MIKRKNKTIYLLLVGMAMLDSFLYLSLRSIEIVAVHQDKYGSHILVKSSPFTDKGKITWWFKNKEMFKRRYDIPKADSKDDFTVDVWLFGDG